MSEKGLKTKSERERDERLHQNDYTCHSVKTCQLKHEINIVDCNLVSLIFFIREKLNSDLHIMQMSLQTSER